MKFIEHIVVLKTLLHLFFCLTSVATLIWFLALSKRTRGMDVKVIVVGMCTLQSVLQGTLRSVFLRMS